MSDDDEYDSNICPLCVEEMDLSDKNFLPCPCGYRVCMWCWHHIRENLNGLCPACRTPYNADPHLFSAVDRTEVVKKNRERKQKEKQEKKVEVGKTTKVVDRKHLHNFRVVQRNLVYVLGLPSTASNSEVLRKAEYFGQYGKITKIVVHSNPNLSQNTISAYVSFSYKEDALAAIQALDGFWIDGHPLRASFGTTKYCNNFIRHVPCQNPDCVYLHDLGDEDDRFTKEEIQSGHSKVSLVPGKDQLLITGQGGPSSTGKKPTGETVLPPPVFIQDSSPLPMPKPTNISHSQSGTFTTTGNGNLAPAEEKESPRDPTPNETSGALSSGKDATVTASPTIIAMQQKQDSYLDETNSDEAKISASTISNSVATTVHSETIVISHSKLIFNDALFDAAAFNGVTWNAVFPVPASSLTVSVWAAVGKGVDDNLSMNPFSRSSLTFSQLLDLTLPPVDAQLPPRNFTQVGVNRGNNMPNTSASLPAPPAVNGTGFNALRQLLPTVNLSYASNNRPQSNE